MATPIQKLSRLHNSFIMITANIPGKDLSNVEGKYDARKVRKYLV